MNVEIKKWSDVDGDDWSSLLVGNGGSIAIDSRFGYPSLHEVARKLDLLKENGRAVFDQYGSTNFEFILETLSHALRVEKALALDPSKVAATHDEVQRALIETVKATHCGPEQVRGHLGPLTRFLRRFETVVTFNYDLTLYWAMIEANATVLNCNWFKDGFVDKGSFVTWWPALRKRHHPATGSTLVFFGHGSLVLGRDLSGNEVKIHAKERTPGWDTDLLNTIAGAWTTGGYSPLFISEGESASKRRAIQGSRYLSVVHDQVMSDLGDGVVTYGFGFAENDAHVLAAMRSRTRLPKRIAIGVYTGQPTEEQQAFCHRAIAAIKEQLGAGVGIVFFDHASPGCWINP